MKITLHDEIDLLFLFYIISHNFIHNYIMDVFIEIEFNLCDDHYYGYRENLLSVCGSFDEAKAILKIIKTI